MTSGRPAPRRGYALLAVLWICVGIGALTLLLSAASRDAIGASRNRIALTAASWNASACLAQVRAALRDSLMDQARPGAVAGTTVWGRVDRVVRASASPASLACALTARAVGSRLDVNDVDEATLSRLLCEIGMPSRTADSAAAAIMDWRDADEDARPLGAERAWYEARRRAPPSNAPFVDRRELRLVRGLESIAVLDSVLDVEPGPLALNQAPAEVLALLPGFTPELVQRVMDRRRIDEPIRMFLSLSDGLSRDARDSLALASARLPGLVVLQPTAWVLTARSTSGRPPVTVAIEVRIGRSGAATMTARRRSWIE